MFDFFRSVFGGAEKCSCKKGDHQCAVCVAGDEKLKGDLGLSRQDVNFYFAAISVCRPFFSPFQLPTPQESDNDPQLAPKPPQSTTLNHQKVGSQTNPSSTGTPHGRYDFMSSIMNTTGPRERYYVPAANRINRCSSRIHQLPTPQLPTPRTSTSTQPPPSSSLLNSSVLNSSVLSELKEALESYRMLVTNTKNAEIPPSSVPESVVVTVSLKSILDKAGSTYSTLNSNAWERRASNDVKDMHAKHDMRDMQRSSQITQTSSQSSASFDTREPSALVVTIPTPAAVIPTSFDSRPTDLSNFPETPPTTGMARRLLSLSPGLEEELADRAADIWGVAVGFDAAVEPQKPDVPIPETVVVDGRRVDGHDNQCYDLKERIRKLMSSLNLLDKFERELKVVKKGNSKFHQAQQVVPGVWVGSFYTASNKVHLYSLGITHIVCCVNVQPPFTRDFHYIVLPCEDKSDQDILRFFPRTNHFIRTALAEGGRVLVHCGAGISRAPTVCAAFLIEELKVSSTLALRLVQAARPFADPNQGFREQLERFESLIPLRVPQFPEIRESLEKIEKSEEVPSEAETSDQVGSFPKCAPNLKGLILSSSLLAKQLEVSGTRSPVPNAARTPAPKTPGPKTPAPNTAPINPLTPVPQRRSSVPSVTGGSSRNSTAKPYRCHVGYGSPQLHSFPPISQLPGRGRRSYSAMLNVHAAESTPDPSSEYGRGRSLSDLSSFQSGRMDRFGASAFSASTGSLAVTPTDVADVVMIRLNAERNRLQGEIDRREALNLSSLISSQTMTRARCYSVHLAGLGSQSPVPTSMDVNWATLFSAPLESVEE